MQGFVCRALYICINMVATIVLIAVIVVASCRDPPSAGMPALEHAANFLAKRAQEADGEWVCAHAMVPDGVFAVCSAVVGRWLAIAQEEVDASERGDDDDCECYYKHEEGSMGGDLP
jgi:hypothetical protein